LLKFAKFFFKFLKLLKCEFSNYLLAARING